MKKLLMKAMSFMVVATLILGQACTEQKLLLRLNVEQGKKYNYNVSMNNHMQQEMQGTQMEMDQKMAMNMSMEILEKLENGNIKMRMNYQSIRMEMKMMGQEMIMDSEKAEGDTTLNAFFDIMKKLDLITEMTPTGKLVKVSGFETIFQELADKNIPPQQVQQLAQAFSTEEGLQNMFGNSFQYFPEEKVGKGDVWNMAFQIPGMEGVEMQTNYEVAEISANQVKLNINTIAETPETHTISSYGMQMEADILLNQTGNIDLDKNTGMVITSNINQDLEMTMKMPNPQTNEIMEMPMKMKSEIKVEVSEI